MATVYPGGVRGRQTYVNDGGSTTTTGYDTNWAANQPVYNPWQAASGHQAGAGSSGGPGVSNNQGFSDYMLNNRATTGQNNTNQGTPNGGNTGGGTGGSGGGGGGGGSSKSAWEDAYKKYIESLQKTRDEAMAYRKGLYEQALLNNGQYYKDEQRLANREFYARNRKLNQMYGSDLTGPGLSNRYASNAMLTNALTSAKNRQNNANQSAEAEYHNALSNIQNAYAQGMYNAYGTEYGIDRNLEYQRYLLEHGYL